MPALSSSLRRPDGLEITRFVWAPAGPLLQGVSLLLSQPNYSLSNSPTESATPCPSDGWLYRPRQVSSRRSADHAAQTSSALPCSAGRHGAGRQTPDPG